METTLSQEELAEKVAQYEAIINDQQVLIQQLMEQNKKLLEIVDMQKQYIHNIRTMMGGGLDA